MLICKFNDLENEYPASDFSESGHIITLTSEENLPEDTSGFVISREGKGDNWDYSSFVTVYRVLNKKQIQFSDDGSVYVPQTKEVIVSAVWNDGDDVYKVRPEEVEVEIYRNGKKSVNVTLTKSKNYTKIYKERPVEDVYTIVAPDLPEYEKNVSGTTATYSIQIPQPRQITTDDMSEAICDLFEGNEPKNICNIYASYCENNIKNFNDDVPEAIKESVLFIINKDHFTVNEDGTCSLTPINIVSDEVEE